MGLAGYDGKTAANDADNVISIELQLAMGQVCCADGHGAACCSVLPCFAVCCSVLPCFAVCCSVLQSVAACCRALQCVAACCRALQCA